MRICQNVGSSLLMSSIDFALYATNDPALRFLSTYFPPPRVATTQSGDVYDACGGTIHKGTTFKVTFSQLAILEFAPEALAKARS